MYVLPLLTIKMNKGTGMPHITTPPHHSRLKKHRSRLTTQDSPLKAHHITASHRLPSHHSRCPTRRHITMPLISIPLITTCVLRTTIQLLGSCPGFRVTKQEMESNIFNPAATLSVIVHHAADRFQSHRNSYCLLVRMVTMSCVKTVAIMNTQTCLNLQDSCLSHQHWGPVLQEW